MGENDACSSYRKGRDICADGFIQLPACRGMACFSCGHPLKTRPYCERDELPAHMVTDTGAPRFYGRSDTQDKE